MRRSKVSESRSEASDNEDPCNDADGRVTNLAAWSSSSDDELADSNCSSDNDSGFMGSSNKKSRDEILENKQRDSTNENDVADSSTEFGSVSPNTKAEGFDRANLLRIVTTIHQECIEQFGVIDGKDKDVIAEYEKWAKRRFRELYPNVPDEMMKLLIGIYIPGDCGRSPSLKPEWLDMEKLRRGQKFAQDNTFSVYFAELLSLFGLFCFEDGLRPLILTGKSSTPFAAFQRYLSTGLRIRRWYTEDIWDPNTKAAKDIASVRTMHAAVKRRLDKSTNEEIDAATKISNPWCPKRDMLLKDFADTCPEMSIDHCPHFAVRRNSNRPKGINQLEMAFTQCGFVGFVTLYPKELGVHSATDEDLEAFCHLWRSIGYQLGIEDDYNFCSGTLEDVRKRTRGYLELWVKPNLPNVNEEWEHMMRCVFAGVSNFLPGATFESALLFLTELLGLEMPRLYASLSYADWIRHNLTKSLYNYTIRLPGMRSFLNRKLNTILDRAENFSPEEIAAFKAKTYEYEENSSRT